MLVREFIEVEADHDTAPEIESCTPTRTVGVPPFASGLTPLTTVRPPVFASKAPVVITDELATPEVSWDCKSTELPAASFRIKPMVESFELTENNELLAYAVIIDHWLVL